MGKSRVSQRIVRAASGIDVESNRGVDYATECVYPDITEDYPALAADHSIALAASPRQQPNAKRYAPVRSVFSLGRREENVSAPCRRVWLTRGHRKYIVCGDYRYYLTYGTDTSREICGCADPDYGILFRGEAST